MNILELVVLVCKLYSKCLGKSISEVVACSWLKCLAIVHKCLYCVCCLCSGKLLLLCLLSTDNRHSQNILTEISVQIQHLYCSCLSLLGCCMSCVSLLPQEFSWTKERSCLLLPTHYWTPLIIYPWQITIWLNIILVEIAEQSLWCRSYTHTLCKRIESTICNPCYLRCKSLNVILLFLKKAFWNKHRHVHILHSCSLESLIKLLLYKLPDCISCRLDSHTSLHVGIRDKSCLEDNISIPLCKIFIHGSNSFNHLLIVCHLIYLLILKHSISAAAIS